MITPINKLNIKLVTLTVAEITLLTFELKLLKIVSILEVIDGNKDSTLTEPFVNSET